MTYDVTIVGAGLVGLATGRELATRYPNKSILILEKETAIAKHQSGNNSGVIHSGIYYKPGSLKAINCRSGRQLLVEYCKNRGISYEVCGKIIVAADESERERLQNIYSRGLENDIRCTILGKEQITNYEPHATGVEAIHVPDAGIVDYKGVAAEIAKDFYDAGNQIHFGAEVTGIREFDGELTVETSVGEFTTRYFVNCAGLYSDQICKMTGIDPGVQIVPFRGEYYELLPHARHLCKNLIYPVPDPAYPFLGVHFTRMYDGRIECGPSAILGFAREGYKLNNIDGRELLEILRYKGFHQLARQHWRKGVLELRQSTSKSYYLKTMRKLIPSVKKSDIKRAGAGVRAQALLPDGSMLHDFLFKENDRVVNVCNAASPAATACFSVGRNVVDRLAVRFR